MPDKISYGEFGHVKLSREELDKLSSRFGIGPILKYVGIMDAYLENHPRKKYKSHYAALLQWLKRDGVQELAPKPATPDPEEIELRVNTIARMFERDFKLGFRDRVPGVDEIRDYVLRQIQGDL